MSNSLNQLDIYMQPLQECNQTITKLMALQQYCFEDVVSAGFEQLRTLSQCSDPGQAMSLNFHFCKGLEAHANYLSDQTYATLADACDASLDNIGCASEKVASQWDHWLYGPSDR